MNLQKLKEKVLEVHEKLWKFDVEPIPGTPKCPLPNPWLSTGYMKRIKLPSYTGMISAAIHMVSQINQCSEM